MAARKFIKSGSKRPVKFGTLGSDQTAQFSDWAAAIAPVIKGVGSMRIRGVYKLTSSNKGDPI